MLLIEDLMVYRILVLAKLKPVFPSKIFALLSQRISKKFVPPLRTLKSSHKLLGFPVLN